LRYIPQERVMVAKKDGLEEKVFLKPEVTKERETQKGEDPSV